MTDKILIGDHRPETAHQYLFLLTKCPRYFYDAEAVREKAIEGDDMGVLRSKQHTDGTLVSSHAPSIQKRIDAGIDSKTAGTGYRNARSVWTIDDEPVKPTATKGEEVTDTILIGDVRERLRDMPAQSVHMIVTSPPYWGLRDYQTAGQLGSEPTIGEYIATMVDVFAEAHRVLRDDGVLFLNMGDGYASNGPGNGTQYGIPEGLKPKDLIGQPWRLAFALQEWGWYLRADIIWHKPNPMPESVTDRPTKSHEYVFLMSKEPRYFYDVEAVREPEAQSTIERWGPSPGTGSGMVHGTNGERKSAIGGYHLSSNGRNARSVWTIATQAYSEAHFATFPEKLAERCIRAGTSEHGVCPECGAPWARVVDKKGGTTGKSWHDNTRGGTLGMSQPHNFTTDGYSVETTGWQSSCTCAEDLDPEPATVLDIFMGAGTSGLVAKKLGRRYVGIELNPEYARMAEKRIKDSMGLFVEA